MFNVRMNVLIPLIIYFIGVFMVGIYSMKFVSHARVNEEKKGGFLKEYLTGDRGLGGFVLAMTFVSTMMCAGSFIGGPGAAYKFGLAWVFLAMTQMPQGYYVLAVLGKRFAIVSRKIKAVTITDFIRQRYESKLIVIISSISIVLFFITAMAAQWIGASRLIQGAVGVPYRIALIAVALTVMLYTLIGGFRAVALTDTLQGCVMFVGTGALLIAAVISGGGVSNIVQSMCAKDPGLISPLGTNPAFTTIAWVTSFWVLVNFAQLGYPAGITRCMSYKSSKSLRNAIIIGPIVSTIIMLSTHLIGAFSITIIPGVESGDLVVPTVSTQLFPGWIAGIILAGPLAAVMSTVDSQLLIVVGGIVKDLYVNYLNPKAKKLSMLTFAVTIAVCVITFITAYNPPQLMVWLNLFATAGLKCTFLWPVVLGLYWKRANKQGAFASIITGIGSYLLFHYTWPRPLGMHTIVLPLILSFVAFVAVSLLTKRTPKRIITKFWGI